MAMPISKRRRTRKERASTPNNVVSVPTTIGDEDDEELDEDIPCLEDYNNLK